MARFAPYGTWTSPITAASVTAGASRIDQVLLSEGAVWWSEGRPHEGGRTQIVRRSPDGALAEMLPESMSARSLVHEYGGGAWWLAQETVFVVNGEDQRIWRIDPGFDPTPLTPTPVHRRGLRYADGLLTPDQRWIVCVQEAHAGEEGVVPSAVEAVNRLVAVPATGGQPVVLREEADFVMSPVLDQRGEMLAWIEWCHPNMPWDETQLWVARLERGDGVPRLVDAQVVAGGSGEAVMMPRWDRDDRLWFVSDRSNWWNLYHFSLGGMPAGPAMAVAPGNIEVGVPPWVFGASRYDVLSDGRVVFAYTSNGIDQLAVYEPLTGRHERVSVPVTSIAQVRGGDSQVVFLAGSFTREASVQTTLLGRSGAHTPLKALSKATEPTLSSSVISEGQPVTFPTSDDQVAHGLYYPPTNAAFVAPDGSRPPLIVTIHGGPTAAASSQLNLRTQFWTSRGFAVVDVDYRGSTGRGRSYRDELRGRWGAADVEDCVAAAEFLARSGRADPDRLVIRGSSAGGLTVLNALIFHDTFAAGCTLYGVADLRALAGDTHKFESRYCDGLVGPLPEAEQLYRDRSPLFHLDRLSTPVIVFQGLDDRIVPPEQAEQLVAALDARRVPHAYVTFEGEGHGFRQASNMERCLEAELSFYLQVLELPHPDGLEPVEVSHLGR